MTTRSVEATFGPRPDPALRDQGLGPAESSGTYQRRQTRPQSCHGGAHRLAWVGVEEHVMTANTLERPPREIDPLAQAIADVSARKLRRGRIGDREGERDRQRVGELDVGRHRE